MPTSRKTLSATAKSFGYDSEWAPLTAGWGRISGLINGSGNIYFHDTGDSFITHLASNERYITQIAGTSGGYSTMDPSYSASQFAATDIKTFFIAIGASYIPDWDTQNNFLRSALGSTTYSLRAMTADNPSFVFHRLNTGATWGEVLRLSQNNTGFYHFRHWNDDPNHPAQEFNGLNRVHIALLGDPTLRFHVVAPPESPYENGSGSTATINWTASDDLPNPGSGEGYHVYRAYSRKGPFTRITSTPATSTSYSQTSVKKGRYVYMVRAVKRTATHEGYYHNVSQGVFVDVDMTTRGTAWTGIELSRSGLPNANFTYANAINSGNAIAGYYDIYSGGPEKKAVHWYWSPPTALSGVWSSSDFTYGNGVNDNYIVIGTVDKYESGGWGTTIRAFRWAMYGGAVTVLDPLTSGGATHGLAINTSGTSVGYGLNQSGINRAIRWDSGQTTATDLNSLAGNNLLLESYAYGINKAGYIVGQSINAQSYDHAFVVPPGKPLHLGDAIDLGTISGAAGSSAAYSINDFNQIVGSSQDGGTAFKPFITHIYATSPTLIPPVSGQSSGHAFDINNSGVVVGESGGKAFIWQEGYSTALDLNSFKPSTLNITLECAEAINHNGVIVGWGTGSGGNRRAFMLSP